MVQPATSTETFSSPKSTRFVTELADEFGSGRHTASQPNQQASGHTVLPDGGPPQQALAAACAPHAPRPSDPWGLASVTGRGRAVLGRVSAILPLQPAVEAQLWREACGLAPHPGVPATCSAAGTGGPRPGSPLAGLCCSPAAERAQLWTGSSPGALRCRVCSDVLGRLLE